MGLLLLGLTVAAFCLRTAMGSVPPILADIRVEWGLSTTAAGVLVSMPLLCLGVGAPFGAALGRRMGDIGGLAACMVVLASGCLLRAAPGAPALFAGTALASVATGVAGTLVPAIAKRLSPERAGTLTGIYSTLLVAGTASASGLAVPVSHAFGHDVRPALAIWALPALAAGLIVGLRRSASSAAPVSATAARQRGWIWRDPVARHATGFLALETIIFYSLFSWLPSIAQEHGVSATAAGAALGVFSFVGMPMSLLVPVLAERRRTQTGIATVLSLVTLAGLVGLLVTSAQPFFLWATILGVAQGGAFGLGLTLLVLRAPDGPSAAELSGMAQTTAYFVAAAAAFLLGVLHDVTGNWTASVIVVVAATVGQLAFGVTAGQDRLVVPPSSQSTGDS
jgi:CP family cyanate transporter-like MFS transporter